MTAPSNYSPLSPLLNKNGATSETPGASRSRRAPRAERPTRGEQAVEDALAHARRNARCDPVADDLLDEAVADRHAAGDRDMSADRAGEFGQAEEPRPAAVNLGDPSHEPHNLGSDEDDVEDGRGLIAVRTACPRRSFLYGMSPDQR